VNPRRISRRFEELAAQRTSGFIAYVTAGDPSLEATLAVAHALESAGVDILELGIPFSDPLADGPTSRPPRNRALAAGMTVSGSLEIVRRFRAIRSFLSFYSLI
jgi:tryptophan synthase alpha chain